MSIILSTAGRTATVTIDREARRNSLDNAALEGMMATLDKIRLMDVSVVVITGTGTKAFCAGSDLKAAAEYSEREAQHHTYLFQKCMEMVDELPCATIAAIEGFCLGGGMELALACDYRIASRTSSFGFPEIMLNALPTGGGTVRAPRAMGFSRAREMLLFGFKIDAIKAKDWNIVSEIVEPGSTLAAAAAMAEGYAAKVDPFAVAMLKNALISSWGQSTRVGHTMAYLADCAMSQTEAFKAGIAGFSKK